MLPDPVSRLTAASEDPGTAATATATAHASATAAAASLSKDEVTKAESPPAALRPPDAVTANFTADGFTPTPTPPPTPTAPNDTISAAAATPAAAATATPTAAAAPPIVPTRPTASSAAAVSGVLPTTGAEALMLATLRTGADVCFANPGTTEMWLVSALDRLWPGVRPVLCLHENVATGAADGYTRIARRAALTLLHLGPGLANGLANLHNARRARSPVINLVGDMATWHRANDPPLNCPLEALAATVSGSVIAAGSGQRSRGANGAAGAHAAEEVALQGANFGRQVNRVASVLAEALRGAGIAHSDFGPMEIEPVGGSVVTVIVPHDFSWEPPPSPPPLPPPRSSSNASGSAEEIPHPALVTAFTSEAEAAAEAFVRDCAAALLRTRNQCGGGGAAAAAAALYLGGDALMAEDGALLAAGQIAAATGAVLICEGAFARVDRGTGLPALRRLPYFPQEAASELARYSCLVLVDCKPPVANFGYKGGPGLLLAPKQEDPSAVWEFDSAALAAAGWSAATALRQLAAALGPDATGIRPLVNCGGVFSLPWRPHVPPPGRLTPTALCAVLAALQPEGAVVVDESLTSGSSYWEASKGCPPFVHLTLTGGAIGSGPPLALGAAVALASALPDEDQASSSTNNRRRVINLQADGSAMYSLQAFWSQAREQLPITTIICANSSYAILRLEAARQRLPGMGPATRALTDLSSPRLDWVSLATGVGVPGCRVDTVEGFAAQLKVALQLPGPFLLQADL